MKWTKDKTVRSATDVASLTLNLSLVEKRSGARALNGTRREEREDEEKVTKDFNAKHTDKTAFSMQWMRRGGKF